MIFEISILVLSLLVFWYLKGHNVNSSKKYPPGPTKLPYIGNLLQIGKLRPRPPYEAYEILSKEYGPVMSIKVGCLDQLVVHDYETMKEILGSEIWINRYFDPWMAQRSFHKSLGIIFISGDVWREMRRFSIRTLRDFGFGKQKSMEMYLNEEINELMESLDESVKEKKSISMKHFFTISVLNILWTMIAGYRFSSDDKRLTSLLTFIDKMTRANAVGSNLVMAFPFLTHILSYTPNGRMRSTFIKQMQDFFTDILKERRSEGSYKEEQKDFIDVFLKEIDNRKNDNPLTNFYTDEQFIIVCFDLFVAGAETTSNTMEFAMLYMVLNPHVQIKVQAEIDKVVGRSRLPSTLDRSEMPYTEATLLEVQRMASVLPMIIRSATQNTKVGSYDINEGTVAALNVYSMHYNKDMWGDPEVFRPERFLDANLNIINANKILPFGLDGTDMKAFSFQLMFSIIYPNAYLHVLNLAHEGKRMCLGEVLAKATMFGYFAGLLQRYSFEVPTSHPRPNSKAMSGFTLSPEPFHVVVKPR